MDHTVLVVLGWLAIAWLAVQLPLGMAVGHKLKTAEAERIRAEYLRQERIRCDDEERKALEASRRGEWATIHAC